MLSAAAITSVSFYFVNEIKYSAGPKRIGQDLNRVQYSALLAEKIGTPPNIQTAKVLADQLQIKMRIEGNGLVFSSTEFDIDSSRIKNGLDGIHKRMDQLYASKNEKILYSIIEKSGYTYIFFYTCDAFLDGRLELLLPLFLIIIGVFLCFYLWTRHLLKPIHALSKGVDEIAQGNFNYSIHTSSKDEVGKLAYSFNMMVDRIKAMLKDKDRLLLDISHELRSPLTRAKIAMELDPNKYGDKIRLNLNEMDLMLDEILESSRLEGAPNLKLEKVNLLCFTQQIISQYINQKPGIEIKQIPDDLFIKCDIQKIKSVFRNVLDNAIKFSSHQSKSIEISIKADDRGCVIYIKDYGIGISQEDQVKVFEPFYCVDKSRTKTSSGYGLGLGICKKIMHAHNGEISFQSSQEIGTIAILSFPNL